MPDPHPTALDDALDRANQHRQQATERRRIAKAINRPFARPLLVMAEWHDSEANRIMAAMKDEGNG